jgi:hypothetical protein
MIGHVVFETGSNLHVVNSGNCQNKKGAGLCKAF